MTNIKKLHIHSDVKMTKLSALPTNKGEKFTGAMVAPITELGRVTGSSCFKMISEIWRYT